MIVPFGSPALAQFFQEITGASPVRIRKVVL